MIILLDLNYTLVSNSAPRGTVPPAMAVRLKSERYRQWLLNLVKPHTVILITARPERWKELTLQRIKQETGWAPHDAYFDDGNIRTPPAIKKKILLEKIFPKYGRGEVFGEQPKYLAIESNPKTRAAYETLGIPSVWVAPSGRKLVGEDGVIISKWHPRPR